MKNEVSNPYQIKLEFKPKTENPSRLFSSFAELINGLENLNHILAQSVDSDFSSRLILNDIRKGSLIADLQNSFSLNKQKLANEVNANDVQNYIDEARSEVLKTITKDKIDVKDLNTLAEKIDKVASKNNLKESFNYFSPDPLDLAKTINEVSESTKRLNDSESFSIKDKSDQDIVINSKAPKIDMEAVEEALTADLLENESEAQYLIKKPDFLGDTQWEFKYGQKNLKAKILHTEWLEKFHSGHIVVVPGDSLRVRIKHTARYNNNGYLISEKIEIVEILQIKHN